MSDFSGPGNGSESFSCIKKTDREQCRSRSHLPKLPKEEMPRELNHGHVDNHALLAGFEEKQLQVKAGKSLRNGNDCFKRPRILQVEEQMSQAEVSEIKAASDKLGSILAK
ncbi:hypothetical protein Dimus_030868 [Dionaea muscipula]